MLFFSFASSSSSQFYFWDYMSWGTRFVSLKLCVGFSIFDSASFLLKLIFLFNKMHRLFDFTTTKFLSKLKQYSDFQVATRSLKIQWYLRELELSRNWPGEELFKLRELKSWVHHSFSIVTFKEIFDIPLLITLFIS